MTEHNNIWHEGIITKRAAQAVEVTINSHTACSGCHANGTCGMSGMKQKLITVPLPDFEVETGDRVMVYATLNSGIYSVLFAYLIPSLWLIVSIALSMAAGLSEIMAAIASLMLLGIYFFILYLFRNRMGKKITFTIKKINEKQDEAKIIG